jgi:hypothetical protein
MDGVFVEPVRSCLAIRTLATGSGRISETALPMIAAEALVIMATAEPETAV